MHLQLQTYILIKYSIYIVLIFEKSFIKIRKWKAFYFYFFLIILIL